MPHYCPCCRSPVPLRQETNWLRDTVLVCESCQWRSDGEQQQETQQLERLEMGEN